MEANLFIGFCAALSIAIAAWRFRALDRSGAIAAVVMGTIVFGIGGVAASAALVLFFLSGSIFSNLHGAIAMPTGKEDSGRSWRQVFANGALPVVALLLEQVAPASAKFATAAYFGAIAAAASDSWATELGTRYGGPARDIISGKSVPAGASGGVSLVGMSATFAGALAIASVPLAWRQGFALSVAVAIGGVAGAIADSVIGSRLQARYCCSSCGCYVERPEHCGAPAVLVSGQRWITNNAVNLAASGTGAVISTVVLDFLR